MKKMILAAVAAVAAFSCQKTESVRSLEINPVSLTFAASGADSQTVRVDASGVEWEYSVAGTAQSWLTVERDGSTLTVSVADNNRSEQRVGEVKVRPKEDDRIPVRSLTVTQEANGNPVELVVTPSSLTFPAEGALPQEVSVTASSGTLAWSARADADSERWMTVTAVGDKITVSVADNPDTARRMGRVTVTVADDAAESRTIVVEQEGKVLPPSLSADPDTAIELSYNSTDNIIIGITAVNCAWEAQALDAEGRVLDWVSVYADADYVNVVPVRNPYKESRSGFIVITADVPEVADIRIPVSQGAVPDYLSTLTGDLDLNRFGFGHGYSVLVPFQVDDTAIPVTTWELYLMSDGVVFAPETWMYGGSGDRLSFQLVTDRVVYNDDGEYAIPDGEYEIVQSRGPAEYERPYTIVKGTEGTTVWDAYSGFWYFGQTEGEMTDSAPVVSGTVTVTRTDEGRDTYRFDFDMEDDFGYRLTGTFSGSIGLVVAGTPM